MKISILDKYIAKHVITMILIVALALLGLDLFFNLVNEVKAVGKGNYTVSTALLFLVMTAPARLYVMFPWAALIGTLISLGALANHSELDVMRTSSISVYRITWAVLKGAMILTFFAVLFGEGIAPTAERLAQQKRTFAFSRGQTIETAYGLWIRQQQNFIHVRTVRGNGELYGVTRYQFDNDRKLKEVIYAASAIRTGKEWHLTKVQGTRFEKDKTIVIKKETEILPELLDTQILETATVKHPERLSLKALWRTIRYRTQNELNAKNYEMAFWTKIFQPVIILLMVFLAVPFVFGPLRSVSMGSRVLVGIMVAFLFHTVNGLFAPLALVYQLPPLLAVLLPIVVFAGAGFWLLQRVR